MLTSTLMLGEMEGSSKHDKPKVEIGVVMITIRRAGADDAQRIGGVFNAAVPEEWTYLGELASRPMFAPEEWNKLVIEHAPPNVLLVAVNECDHVIGFMATHPQEGEM
jgi:hypothetical protein